MSGWRFRWGCRRRAAHAAGCQSLSDLPDGATARIRCTPHRGAREMGLFPGTVVQMLRNRDGERSLLVAAGETRLLITRAIAAHIRLCPNPEHE